MKNLSVLLGGSLCMLAAACAAATTSDGSGDAPQPPNTLSAAERQQGWRLLFDGRSTDGWHVYGKDAATGWTVEEGVLIGRGEGGDLVSDEQFGSFELSVDWKLSPGANSGIFFHVVEDPEKYAGVHHTGPEYQLIDDEGWPGKLEEWQKTGANYAMHLASSRPTRPIGEWNNSRIVVRGPHVEHWLNGVRVLEYEMWDEEWVELTKSGKWKGSPDYGLARRGHLALQDHGGMVSFRNIRVRPLD